MSAQYDEKTQRYALAEVDDLTLFADESFSTAQVDLFDIGGGEESPLARLKTIVLSLDWEISEGNLRDLADEARLLRQTLAANPLADIYLQCLDKISRYIQTAQSNTHPNAIKLLQLYYCDLERLCAATQPWPEDILAMVREDVRRFRILGIQVGSRHSSAQAAAVGLRELEGVAAAQLHRLKGLVLGIDWEVTDKVLEELEQELGLLRGEGIGGHLVGLLLSAMDGLARYMRQAGLRTHAAAFSVLYALYNGVERLLAQPDMPETEAENLVRELGERFEGLKLAVLRKQQEAQDRSQEEEDGRVSPGAASVAAGTTAAGLASAGVAAARTMEISREEPSPAVPLADDEILTLDMDDRSDDYLDATKVQGPALEGVAPPEAEPSALASDSTADPLSLELNERLDAFFGADDTAAGPVAESMPALAAVPGGGERATEAVASASDESVVLELNERLDAFFGVDDTAAGSVAEPMPALATSSFVEDDAVETFASESDESRMLELDERLEAFFSAEDSGAAPSGEEDAGTLTSLAALSAAAAAATGVSRVASEQTTVGKDEDADLPTLLVEGPKAELALLGDALTMLQTLPTAEQVRQWQARTAELLGQSAPEDGRRLPLLLLDTVLAALPGQEDGTETLVRLLVALGRELSRVVASAAPVMAMPPLEQYLAWQREVNRGLAGRECVAS